MILKLLFLRISVFTRMREGIMTKAEYLTIKEE